MATNISVAKIVQANDNHIGSNILMWTDPNVNSSGEIQQAQKTLSTSFNQLRTYGSIDKGESDIQQLSKTSRVTLITSRGFGLKLVPQIHHFQQISRIYVFCFRRDDYLEWARQFGKIKAVIVDLNQLVSKIQFDCEKPVSAFRYTLKYLISAGQFQYNEKTTKDVAREMVERFKTDPKHDFNVFLSETAQLIMYLLKREQDLADFVGHLQSFFRKVANIPRINQRLLIDNILKDADRPLCRRLISLLSKRNPVPMIQFSSNTMGDEHRLTSDIIHVWDYHRPILLSFDIGQCKEKSAMINMLFRSRFEKSTNVDCSSTNIDGDFGYHFNERRPLNIAHTQGNITCETLALISPLFNGFLIHIDAIYLRSNHVNVITYLQSLAGEKNILILIYDTDEEADEQTESILESISTMYPNCECEHLLRIHENKEKVDEVREKLFENTIQMQCFDKKTTQGHLKRLMSKTQRDSFEEEKDFLDCIRAVLIDGKEENYLLYSLFTDLCKKKLKVSQIDQYGSHTGCDTLYNLHLEQFRAEATFKKVHEMVPKTYGAGFEMFVNLLQDAKSRLDKLNFLSMELKKEASKKPKDYEAAHFYRQLSLEIHWRNVIIGSSRLSESEQEIIVTSYRDYIAEGNPFEIVDGDNFEMQDTFLTKVFELFPYKKFFIVTIIGQESSGKSTLLNFLFGTLFEAHDGRCTKGIYGTLINVQDITTKNEFIPLDYDYILVIDTEGVLSALKGDEPYDKRLILFCLAVSHLVIVNIDSRLDASVKSFFVLCTQALKYLQATRVKRPTVHFVFNKRQISNAEYCRQLFETVRTSLEENKLDKEIDLPSENFHILLTAFNRQPLKIPRYTCAALETDEIFVESVRKFCKTIIDSSTDIVRENGDLFCIPTRWIEHASRVLQTIKKHPDLIHFQHAYEREEYNVIQKDIQRDFKQYVSPVWNRCPTNDSAVNDSNQVEVFFQREYRCCLENLEEKLKTHCANRQASGHILKRSLQYMEVQLTNIFESWKITARMAIEKNKINQTIIDIEEKLRKKAISITHENYFKDERSAIEMFENEFKEISLEIAKKFNAENVWKQSIDMVFSLCDTLAEGLLPSANNLYEYLPFLVDLNTSNDQPISINSCLEKIRDKFIKEATDVYPLASHLTRTSIVISRHDIEKSYKHLNEIELKRIYSGQNSRLALVKGERESFSQDFSENWKTIVQTSKCFHDLIESLQPCFNSTNNIEPTFEITFIQDVLGKANKIIQDFNNELDVFNFCLSKQFRDIIRICSVMTIALYYYNRQKTPFLDVIRQIETNKDRLIQRYLPWVIVMPNNDANVAISIADEISQALYRLSERKIREAIDNHINENRKQLERSDIIKEVDDRVRNASDD